MYLFRKCSQTGKHIFSHTIHHLCVLILHRFHNSGDRWISIYASWDTDKVYRLPTSNLNADMTHHQSCSYLVFLSNLSRRPLILHCNKILCPFNSVVMFGEGLSRSFGSNSIYVQTIEKQYKYYTNLVFHGLCLLAVWPGKVGRGGQRWGVEFYDGQSLCTNK